MEVRFHLSGANPTSKVWFVTWFSAVLLVWIKPNILWIWWVQLSNRQLDWGCCCVCFPVSETRVVSPGFKINIKTSLQTLLIVFFSAIWPLINTLTQKKHTFSPQTNWLEPMSVPSCREGSSCSSLLSLVWFSIWFGIFRVLLFNSVFLAFCVSFFCQDSLFLYLIKIWKLNFHSFFSNHLIKISSTTTKKIRSSCSKSASTLFQMSNKH